jgi:hypothetical protein
MHSEILFNTQHINIHFENNNNNNNNDDDDYGKNHTSKINA